MNGSTHLKLLALALATAFIVACGEAEAPAEVAEPRLVRTMTAEAPGAWRKREFPAVIAAAQEADLSFRVAGQVAAIEVAESDEVAAGQLIARLDPADFENRLASVRADYERARADFERASGLVDDGFVSRTDFDKLRAQYAAAESQLEAAERDLDSTRLLAPFAGVVAQRHVENFEEVNAKQPIVTLHDLSTLQVRIDVPESVMIRVRRSAGPRQVNASFGGIPGQSFPLELLEVSSEPDPASRTYEVTFTMAAVEDRVILPGMSATVVVEVPQHEGAAGGVTLPPNVVMEDRNGRFVWLAEPGAPGRATIRRRPVETGELSEAGLTVLSGIAEGDRVVTAGMSRLVDGQEVRLDGDGAP